MSACKAARVGMDFNRCRVMSFKNVEFLVRDVGGGKPGWQASHVAYQEFDVVK
jgi:hypothetical protein